MPKFSKIWINKERVILKFWAEIRGYGFNPKFLIFSGLIFYNSKIAYNPKIKNN